jgi:hypothetical protein
MTVIDNPADRARWGALPNPDHHRQVARRQQRKDAAPRPSNPGPTLTPESDRTRISRRDLVLRAPLTEGSQGRPTWPSPHAINPHAPSRPPAWKPEGHDGPALHFEKEGSVTSATPATSTSANPSRSAAGSTSHEDFNDTAAIVARMDESPSHRGWDLWIQTGPVRHAFRPSNGPTTPSRSAPRRASSARASGNT